MAAHATGRETDASSFLQEAINGGFRQPEMLELETSLADLPQWPELSREMHTPAPAPEFEVTCWPLAAYGPDLVLDRLPPDRELALAERIPVREAGAWATVQMLLEWVTSRWEHANDHVDSQDAIEVLDRASDGERFACVEYSVLLSQALCAIGIPARRVSLFMRDKHVGFGRGHVVSEAWVDDLDRWVVLDGQNGAWWGSRDEPLGLRELQEIEHAGINRPSMVLTSREIADQDQAVWWTYFHAASSSGLGWADTLVPIFQGEPLTARLVVPCSAMTHPDLSLLETGLADTADGPALTFSPVHPFAEGVSVARRELAAGEPFRMSSLPVGDHHLEVRSRTQYGQLRPQPLHVIRR